MHGPVHWARGAKTRSPYDQSERAWWSTRTVNTKHHSVDCLAATAWCTTKHNGPSKVQGTSQLVSIDSHHRDHDGREGLLVPHASIQLFICVLLFRLTSVHYSDSDLQ